MKQKSNVTSLPKKDLLKDKDETIELSSFSWGEFFLCNDVIFVFCFMELNFF